MHFSADPNHESQAMQRTIYDDDHEAFRDSCAAFLAKHVEPNLEKYLELDPKGKDAATEQRTTLENESTEQS